MQQTYMPILCDYAPETVITCQGPGARGTVAKHSLPHTRAEYSDSNDHGPIERLCSIPESAGNARERCLVGGRPARTFHFRRHIRPEEFGRMALCK